MTTPSARWVDLESLTADRALGGAWNDLWVRSRSATPMARAEHVVHWHRRFAPHLPLGAVVVEQGERLLAALPLAIDRTARAIPVARLPRNEWDLGADLLVDAGEASGTALMAALAGGLREVPARGVSCEAVPLDREPWASLLATVRGSRGEAYITPDHPVAEVRLSGAGAPASWEAYRQSWSRNHRRQMTKMEHRAGRTGDVALLERMPTEEEAAELVARGFAVEHRGWKGEQGTSVLSRPEIFAYFREQARLMAREGFLKLTFLTCDGRDIAFEYGWCSKGVYGSVKVGYDEEFASLSPGQYLRLLHLRRLMEAGDVRLVDFLGEQSRATGSWATDTYEVSRLILSNGRLGSRALVRAARAYASRR